MMLITAYEIGTVITHVLQMGKQKHRVVRQLIQSTESGRSVFRIESQALCLQSWIPAVNHSDGNWEREQGMQERVILEPSWSAFGEQNCLQGQKGPCDSRAVWKDPRN